MNLVWIRKKNYINWKQNEIEKNLTISSSFSIVHKAIVYLSMHQHELKSY
jgi:hypothetical protein